MFSFYWISVLLITVTVYTHLANIDLVVLPCPPLPPSGVGHVYD